MKKLIFLLFLTIVVTSCKNTPEGDEKVVVEESFFEEDFSGYEELEGLKDYERQIDTAVYTGDRQDSYRLMNLKKNGDYLVLFYKVTGWDEQKIHHNAYRAIDTILVKGLEEEERLTVGYCNHEDYQEGEVIALVKGTREIEVPQIIKAWRANPESEKIEELESLEGIKCLNEFFESENATIPIEDLS